MTALPALVALAVAVAGAVMLGVRRRRTQPVKGASRLERTPEAVAQQMARELHMRRRTSYTDAHIVLQARIVPAGWSLKGGGPDTRWFSLADLEVEVVHRVRRSRGVPLQIPLPACSTAPPREYGPAGAA